MASSTQEHPELSPHQHFWRARITKTLERLEREARRMLQLEEELGAFATDYYNAVGEVTERLTLLEQQLAYDMLSSEPSAMPAVRAQRDAREARRAELKTRYRHLAKEIHPDRAMVVGGNGPHASHMHTLNAAYEHGDLAALLKLEADMLLASIATAQLQNTRELECALREIDRAADTYAQGYRELLNSPLNELMLRAMSARLAGWDWTQAVVRRIERTIEEKERALVMANIAAIGQWRELTASAA